MYIFKYVYETPILRTTHTSYLPTVSVIIPINQPSTFNVKMPKIDVYNFKYKARVKNKLIKLFYLSHSARNTSANVL